MASGHLKHRGEGEQRICKHDEAVPLKEEAYTSPESCQQLDPEFLNCAAELSRYSIASFPARNGTDDDLYGDHLSPDKDVNVGEQSKNSKTSDCQTQGAHSQSSSAESAHDKPNRTMEHVTSSECVTEEIKSKSDSMQDLSHGSPTLKRTVIETDGNVDNPPHVEDHILPTLDIEEDLYQSEEDIQEEQTKKVSIISDTIAKENRVVGVEPEVDIVEYSSKEWRGKTNAAKTMKEGYREVSHSFNSIRRVRGDNYCALRATLFQALRQTTKVPPFLNEDLMQLPEQLLKNYDWINQWNLWHTHGSKKVCIQLKEYLEFLKKKWAELSEIKTPRDKQKVCDDIFQNEGEEYCLYEAVKFLMLKTAIDFYNANKEGKEVPVFSWLLFARNTSNNPSEFMKNHLNKVGHTGGLEQVEMFLLGYALQHSIKVYRLYKYGTDEFITQYPNDKPDWPTVTLITEDDRHYNVPVGEYEETSL
uniref:OTU deubiquitinase with linear linkage specificity n=1 Tax=Leptobrachium leishanense TaxID=445787 RepID=A0A8C5Q9L7_9ANUR